MSGFCNAVALSYLQCRNGAINSFSINFEQVGIKTFFYSLTLERNGFSCSLKYTFFTLISFSAYMN